MTVLTRTLGVNTRGHTDIVNITSELIEIVTHGELVTGILTVFVPGSTASVSTIEFEPGATRDIRRVLDRLAPEGGEYEHHATWGDDNGSAHVRACLLGPSVSIPIVDGALTLGTWQQVVLLDFDTQPRARELIVQVIGE
ncbi:MAG: secondary thiamine-phosphate synthase enzyme YjbQ [Nannocystaceae bacterium]